LALLHRIQPSYSPHLNAVDWSDNVRLRVPYELFLWNVSKIAEQWTHHTCNRFLQMCAWRLNNEDWTLANIFFPINSFKGRTRYIYSTGASLVGGAAWSIPCQFRN
jgi:hypothetical protein